MRRLLVALMLVLATAGSASAHGHVFFGINLGWPLFYPYAYPAYSYPVTYGGYYAPAPVTYYRVTPDSRRVVERVYVNGQLVEERVKVYGGGDRYYYDRSHRDYDDDR